MPIAKRRNLRTRNAIERRTNDVSPQERRFCEEYLVDLDAKQASMRAGLPANSGPHLLGQPRIQACLARLQAERNARVMVSQDDVLRRWKLLAFADVNELVEHRRVCCRYCWGTNGEYQRTRGEMDRALRQHNLDNVALVKAGKEARFFEELGGEGYDANRDPNPGCTECFGNGTSLVYFRDTRKLSPSGQILYAGAEVGRDGTFKLRLRDQEHALDVLSDHVGLKRAPNFNINLRLDPTAMSDAELDDLLASHGVVIDDAEYELVDEGGEGGPGAGDPREAAPVGGEGQG